MLHRFGGLALIDLQRYTLLQDVEFLVHNSSFCHLDVCFQCVHSKHLFHFCWCNID